MRQQSVIRDSDTGRFASRSTFNRSVSHGGTRYKEEVVEYKEKKGGDVLPPEPEGDWEEWAITFQYGE